MGDGDGCGGEGTNACIAEHCTYAAHLSVQLAGISAHDAPVEPSMHGTYAVQLEVQYVGSWSHKLMASMQCW